MRASQYSAPESITLCMWGGRSIGSDTRYFRADPTPRVSASTADVADDTDAIVCSLKYGEIEVIGPGTAKASPSRRMLPSIESAKVVCEPVSAVPEKPTVPTRADSSCPLHRKGRNDRR